MLQPLLMKEGLELPPVMTILGQALFSLVFGFLGLLLAVPLMASVMVPVKLLYVRDVVGDEVSVPGEDSGRTSAAAPHAAAEGTLQHVPRFARVTVS